MRSFFIVFLLLFVHSFQVRAQSISDLEDLDFDDLLNVDVITVSSRQPITKKQVPGNVTVFNQGEIEKTGARTLVDLLRLVPGLEFGYNTQNGVGLGVRGNWALEGKALIVIDGIPVNENLFAGTAHFLDFPVTQIKQIEVIRGPGASFYGGYAELAVVNIKTKATEGFEGLAIDGTLGNVASGLGTRMGNLMAGWGSKDAFATISVFAGAFQRGEGNYTDASGNNFDVFEANTNEPLMINSHLGYKGLKFNMLYRQDNGTFQDAYNVLANPTDIENRHIFGQVLYDIELKNNWLITPKLSYALHQPWKREGNVNNPSQAQPYQTSGSRALASVMVSGEIGERLSTLSGAEIFVDRGFNPTLDDRFGSQSDQETIQYTNFSVFTQENFKTDLALFNAGLRFDYNDSFGSALMPWMGANFEWNKFNVKLLYGYTFRPPSIENIRLSQEGDKKPERTRLYEAEIGYQLSPNAFLSVTLFDQKLNSPIIFGVLPGNEHQYLQFGNTGSRGIETELRLNSTKHGYVNLSYSFYAAAHSQVPDFQFDQQLRTGEYLGFGQHKISMLGSVNLPGEFTFNPTFTYLSKRFGYSYSPAANGAQITEFDPTFLVNFNIQKSNVIPNVDVILSVFDALDQQYVFLQPFNATTSPMPGLAREILLTAKFRFQ